MSGTFATVVIVVFVFLVVFLTLIIIVFIIIVVDEDQGRQITESIWLCTAVGRTSSSMMRVALHAVAPSAIVRAVDASKKVIVLVMADLLYRLQPIWRLDLRTC